jgi:hypothetical protein
VRPARNWKDNNYLGNDPASTVRRYKPVNPVIHAQFAEAIADIAPDRR